mmetsp:Transcript_14952/g.36185  ORF Transcript_14952/g.36185 Transcript_14952/m.36185 type:complete len:201 (+) Transcript_14952:335-937(+)
MATPHMFIAQLPDARRPRQEVTMACTRPMMAASVAGSRLTPTSVAISALPSSAVSLALIALPFSCAPRPLTAVNVSPKMGFSTTPTTGTLLTARPMETQLKGKRCTKLVVPSTGSTNHVGASFSGGVLPSPAATLSSPTNECAGNFALSSAKMMSSHFLSVAVTRSTAPLYSTARSASHAALISSPAAVAAASATRRQSS